MVTYPHEGFPPNFAHDSPERDWIQTWLLRTHNTAPRTQHDYVITRFQLEAQQKAYNGKEKVLAERRRVKEII
jgi:hypothetical protein